MLLVDTTVWIDFFNAHDTKHTFYFENAVKTNVDICICGVILAEILQGIRDQGQFDTTKQYLENFIYLEMYYSVYLRAAEIYRSLRAKGITIRKPIDCIIASVAIEYNIPLLHNDRDFERLEKYTELMVINFEK
ncbi:PIN domain nuclease [candidate division KSB1 bacterium]|nr:PIN domain nuclease [candidate division KSB1 bacterium]